MSRWSGKNDDCLNDDDSSRRLHAISRVVWWMCDGHGRQSPRPPSNKSKWTRSIERHADNDEVAADPIAWSVVTGFGSVRCVMFPWDNNHRFCTFDPATTMVYNPFRCHWHRNCVRFSSMAVKNWPAKISANLRARRFRLSASSVWLSRTHITHVNPLTVTIFTTVFGNRGGGKIIPSLSQVLVQLLTKFQRLYPCFGGAWLECAACNVAGSCFQL